MKIVFATGPIDEKGGPAKYATHLAEQFVRQGIKVKIVPFQSSLPSGLRHLAYFLRLLFALISADAVLAFDTWSVGFPAVFAAKTLRKASIVRIGGDFLWEQYVERTGDMVKLSYFYQNAKDKLNSKEQTIFRGTGFLLRNASVLAFNSQFQIETYRAAYGLSLQNAVVIENVYPHKKENSDPTKKNFVAAGRALKLKQEALLLQVFEELQETYPDITLDLEPLSPEEHQARVASCYAVILGSLSDVSPNVIIDAVIHERPFICTSDTGIKERLENVGLFIDTQNKDALSRSIESLLDPSVYKKMKTQVKLFSFVRTWEDVSNDFLTAIRSCVSSR